MQHLASSRRNLSLFLLITCIVMFAAVLALPWLFSPAAAVIRDGVAMPTNLGTLQFILYGGMDLGGIGVLLVLVMLGGILLGLITGFTGLLNSTADRQEIEAFTEKTIFSNVNFVRLNGTADRQEIKTIATLTLVVGWTIVLPGAIFAYLTLAADTYLPSIAFAVVFLGGFLLTMVGALVRRRLKAA